MSQPDPSGQCFEIGCGGVWVVVRGGMAEGDTRLCGGCRRPRPVDSFEIMPKHGSRRVRGFVCEDCRHRGRKVRGEAETAEEIVEVMAAPARPAAEVLSEPRDFALLRLLDQGATLAQAEVAVGYERGGASRKKLLGTEEFRLGMAYALVRRGVDRDRVAEVIAEAMGAERSRWNPVSQEFEAETDHSVRLRAADTAAKLLDVVPRNHQTGGGATVVIIKTNLEESPREKPIEGTYVVEKGGDQ